MKRILTFAILTLSGLICTYAQNIINLKNGSIVRGELVESIPNEKVSIKTSDGSIIVYTADEVASIVKDKEYTTAPQASTRYLASRGYRGFVDITPSWGFIGFNTMHGYQFSHNFFLGGGIKYIVDFNGDDHDLPLYVALQGNFGQKKAQFTIGGRLGLLLYSKHDYLSPEGEILISNGFGGFYLNLNMGVRVAFSSDYAMTIKPEMEMCYWGFPSIYPGISLGFEF